MNLKRERELRNTAPQLRQNLGHGHIGGLGYHWRELQRDGLLGINRDSVENYLGTSSLNVKNIQQVFDADVVCGECGRIIAREFGRGAGDSAGRVAVCGCVDEDDVAGALQRPEQCESARAAVQALHIGWEWVLLQSSYYMDADAFIAHDDVAQAQHQCLLVRLRQYFPHCDS